VIGVGPEPPPPRILAVYAVDVDAEVLANTRLSDDYNVVALAAPAIAAAAGPASS
jgi:hypothetical protein